MIAAPAGQIHVLEATADVAAVINRPHLISHPLSSISDTAPRKLFCIHPGYGLVSGYRTLAQELDGVVAVIGIESPIYADPDWRADDLDEQARHYVEGVRKHQAKGPYSLLGWSHGGLIAVAMAHQLRQDGHDVDFIGLVDVAAEMPAQSSVLPTSKESPSAW